MDIYFTYYLSNYEIIQLIPNNSSILLLLTIFKIELGVIVLSANICKLKFGYKQNKDIEYPLVNPS